MTQHTNSVTAAALSLCVSVEALAHYLPAIREMDARIRACEHKDGQTALSHAVTPCMCKQGTNDDCTK